MWFPEEMVNLPKVIPPSEVSQEKWGFAYILAMTRGSALLFGGYDFSKTEVAAA